MSRIPAAAGHGYALGGGYLVIDGSLHDFVQSGRCEGFRPTTFTLLRFVFTPLNCNLLVCFFPYVGHYVLCFTFLQPSEKRDGAGQNLDDVGLKFKTQGFKTTDFGPAEGRMVSGVEVNA